VPVSAADACHQSITRVRTDGPRRVQLCPAELFRDLGIPIVNGGSFTAQEAETQAPVVVISEATARRFWPGQDSIGKRLLIGSVDARPPFAGEQVPFSPGSEVIGVVGDVRSLFLSKLTIRIFMYHSRRAASGPARCWYAPAGTHRVCSLRSAAQFRRVDANFPVRCGVSRLDGFV